MLASAVAWAAASSSADIAPRVFGLPTSPFQPVRSRPLKSGVNPAAFCMTLASVTSAPPWRLLSSAASMKA